MHSAQLMPKHTAQLAVMQVAYASTVKKDPSPRRTRRRERLLVLIEEAGGPSELARLAGTPKSHISAMKADSRGMGDELAAKLEAAMGKPQGWMDDPSYDGIGSIREPAGDTAKIAHIDAGNGYADLPTSKGMVQVTAIARVSGDGQLAVEAYEGGLGGWVQAPWHRGIYALKVHGDALAPTIENGKFILIAADTRADPGEDVVITFRDGRKVVRKLLVVSENHAMVLPLNGGTPQHIERQDVQSIDPILGVLTARSWRQHLPPAEDRRTMSAPPSGGNQTPQDDDDSDAR